MNSRTIWLLVLIAAFLTGCESAEKYKKSASTADTTHATGAIEMKGDQAQVIWARHMATGIETAKNLWEHQNLHEAIATADSLSRIVDAVMDTIPLGGQIGSFLLIYSADTYQHLIAWQKTTRQDSAAAVSTRRYEALGERLKQRRGAKAASKTP